MQQLAYFLFVLLLNANNLFVRASNDGLNENDNYLLLVISLDGFRYDYLDKYSNLNGILKNISNNGVRVAWSQSIFPTNTYPNHWSIVTGLYPESHGILNNDVYDPLTKIRFRMAVDKEDQIGWFQQAEPIWIKNEIYNGDKYDKHSVVFDWPGSSAPINNRQAYVYRHTSYDNWFLKEFNKSVEQFVDHLDTKKTNLALLYLGEPDMTGHLYGPDSKEVAHVVSELDYVLAYLFELMKTKKNYNFETDVDLLIVTDHGMTTIRTPNEDVQNRHVYLSDYIDVEKYLALDRCSYGSFSELWLNDDKDLQAVFKALREAKEREPHKLKEIYLKSEIPERFHIKTHYRLAPIVLLAHNGYQIILERNKPEKYSITRNKYHGNHGYEHNDDSMRGIFLAHGKSFKKSYSSKDPINVIDIYSLMCHLLKLEPNPNNGSLIPIQHVLSDEHQHEDLMKILLYGGVFFIIFLIFVSVIMPMFAILSSVKVTCENNNIANQNQIKPKTAQKPITKKTE